MEHMAVYPAGNPGVIPIASANEHVYALRNMLGDTQYSLYAPNEPGFADFTMYSDAELLEFYTQGGDSVLRGAGFAYLALAAQAARESKFTKDYDLQVDLTKRSGDYRATAAMYFEMADQADDGNEDAFQIVSTGQRCTCRDPELAPFTIRWCGVHPWC